MRLSLQTRAFLLKIWRFSQGRNGQWTHFNTWWGKAKLAAKVPHTIRLLVEPGQSIIIHDKIRRSHLW
jgi:hypothetical protein